MSIIMGPAVMFTPANRPERFAKGAERADMVILDLEDGAGPHERDAARANIIASNLDPRYTIVRTVSPDTEGFAEDVAAIKQTDYTTVMVPKVETAIPAELDGYQVIAMLETPQAVVNLEQLAQVDNLVGFLWGAEDLTVRLGGTHSRLRDDELTATGYDLSHKHRPYRSTMAYVREKMLITAAAFGKFCLDAVFADFSDLDGLYVEALDAARSGFIGSAIIHPGQAETVRRAYAPEPEAVVWAQRVVAEAAHHPGAFQLDGEMVDAPLIEQARIVLSRIR